MTLLDWMMEHPWIVLVAGLLGSLALALALAGDRRSAVAGWLMAIALYVLTIAPLAAADFLGGRSAMWCTIPLVAAASWFGRSPLGVLNFLLLQWFGVRLQAEFDREAWLKGPRGRWWASDVPRTGRIGWSLLRWVWPLTGWWGRYRWIAKRGAV